MTYRGIVNGVLSGDSLLVRFLPPCPDPLQIISLENVCAPRYGSNNGDKLDQPHGCESFEFLRQLCVGQRITIPQNGRPSERTRGHSIFGQLPVVFRHVSLCNQDNKDVALITTRAGWTRVRQPNYTDDYIESLLDAQKKAQAENIGIWRPNGIVRHLPVRYDPEIIVKTKYYNALVEGVLNGTTLTLFLLPRNEYIFFQIDGCTAPSTRKDNTAEYGQESREFIARFLLNRIIRIQICDYTDNKLFIGCILGRSDMAVRHLIENGLAKFRPYISQFVLTGDDYIRAENKAKLEKKNLWSDFVVTPIKYEKRKIKGHVYSIINSYIINISTKNEPNPNNPSNQTIHKIHLNCIRVPPFCSEPFGFESREYLRKLLVGKDVEAIIEGKIEDYGEFGTVFYNDICINEQLCRLGYACTADPLAIGCTSDYYNAFLAAENIAKEQKLGIFNDDPNSQPEVFEFGKITSQKLNGPQKGIIEKCLKGCRFLVSVPSKRVMVRLGLNGITPSDTFVDEAKTFCGMNYTQRDVLFEISNVDKSHLAYSNMTLIFDENNNSSESNNSRSNIDVAADILANGFAEVNPNSPINQDHIAAQNRAKREGKGIWKSTQKKEVPPLEFNQVYRVNVEEIIDPLTYVVHHLSEKVEQALQSANKPITFPPPINELVVAKPEDMAYLAVVEKVNEDRGTCNVSLVEFKIDSSQTEISKDELFELPESLKDMEKQTRVVHLGCLSDPIDNTDYIHELTDGAILYMHLMYVDDHEEVLLTDSELITGGSLNAMLINQKIARYKEANVNEKFKDIVNNLKMLSDAVNQS